MSNEVSANDRRARYEVTAPSGQSVFDIDFPLDEIDYIVVYKDGDPVGDYTVDLTALTVTLDTAAPQNAIVTLEGLRTLERVNGYPLRGDLRSALINDDINAIYQALQEMRRDIDQKIGASKAEADDTVLTMPVLSGNEGKAILAGAAGFTLSESDFSNLDTIVSDAQAAKTAAELAETNAASAETAAVNAQSYAEEWASKAEDSLVSAAAGGDEVDDYSAKHWANKAAASAASADVGDINALTAGAAVAADELAFADVSDSNNVKKDTLADVVAGGLAGAGADLSVNNNKITDVTDPTAAQDAATKAYVDNNTSTGEWELKDSGTFSGSPNFDVTDISKKTKIKIFNLTCAGNGQPAIRTSTDNGSTFDSGAGHYAHSSIYLQANSGTLNTSVSTSEAYIQLGFSEAVENVATADASLEIVIDNPADASAWTVVHFEARGTADTTVKAVYEAGMGVRLSAADVDAIRFYDRNSNNITGSYEVWETTQ